MYQPTEEEMSRWVDPYENGVCRECNRGGDDNLMRLCDICDSSAHTYCVGLGRQVPEGNWYCGGCRSGGEGPSAQETVVHCRESNTNPANSSSGSFGSATPSGVFQRPPPINTHPSLQGFALEGMPLSIGGGPLTDEFASFYLDQGSHLMGGRIRFSLTGQYQRMNKIHRARPLQLK